MSKMSINEFMKDAKSSSSSSAKHLDLKAKGKAIVFLHPDSGIYKRNTYWFPYYGEVEENGTKTKKTYDIMIVCPGMDINPIAQLRKALRENEDIDFDEVILRVGQGDQMVEYTKGDIIGEDGYDWKKNLAYKTEYLFGVIDKDNPKEIHPFVAPKSLGKKITKVIEDQIEEEGEEDGNPFINPYAFKLTFDKNLPPSEMYNATWNKATVTPEIQELLDAEGPDLQPLTEPTPVEKIAYLVREALVYDEEELGLDLSAADDFDPSELNNRGRGNNEADDDIDDEEEKPSKKANKKPAKANKKPAKKAPVEDKDEDAEDDEDEEDVKPSKKAFKKSAKPQKPPVKDEDEESEIEYIECPECQEAIPADSETCPECGSDVAPF